VFEGAGREMKGSEVSRLYELHGHRVFRRCLHLLRDEGQAMDILQETWVALMGRPFGFPDDDQALAWLLRVSTNKVLNEFRHRKYWKMHQFTEGVDDPHTDPMPGFENRHRFNQLLSRLGARDAAIVTGYFVEGYTLNEVASECQVSVPTVRRVLQRFLDSPETSTPAPEVEK